MISRWRLAARLARREVRRHWARSALVVVIIALPVLGAQAAAISWRSIRGPGEAIDSTVIVEPQTAGADELTGFDPRLGRPPAIEGATRVETGFSFNDWTQAVRDGEGPDDLASMTVVGFIPDASEVDLASGRVPANRREAVVSKGLARIADLEVGDTLEVIASRVELEVVGVSGSDTTAGATAWAGPPVGGDDWVPGALARLRDSGSDLVYAEVFDLYWLPGDGPLVQAEEQVGDGVMYYESPQLRAQELVVGAASGAIAVGFVATICSAAFAIGARRQLRSLGTMATAGAAPSDLRRAVLLQGTCLGIAGGVLATVLVYVGRLVILQRYLDDGRWSVAKVPHLVVGVAVLGVAAGTLAALVPALTASRIPTLSALAGRRPTRRRPLRSPYAGIVMVAGGLAMLSWSTSGSNDSEGASRAAVAAVAVLLTMAGSVALSPALVAGLARLCARAPGTVRLSGRSIARDGMRSAAVVASAAVAIALPVVGLVYGAQDIGYREPDLTAGEQASLARLSDAEQRIGTVDVDGPDEETGPAVDEIRGLMGPGTVVGRSILLGPSPLPSLAVDPDELRRVTGDDEVADHLAAGDVVTFAPGVGAGAPWFGNEDQWDPPEGRELHEVRLDDVSDLTLLLISKQPAGLVADRGEASTGEHVLLQDHPLTEDEGRRIAAVGPDDGSEPTRALLTEDLATVNAATSQLGVFPDAGWGGDDVGWDGVPAQVIALGASVLLALAVIGLASALAAADGRPDEKVVAAVGAPPSVVRRRRVLEATFTAAAAAVLGGGLGALATLVLIHNPGFGDDAYRQRFRFPVLDVLGVTVGTVLVVGGVTWLALTVSALLRGRRDLFLVDG